MDPGNGNSYVKSSRKLSSWLFLCQLFATPQPLRHPLVKRIPSKTSNYFAIEKVHEYIIVGTQTVASTNCLLTQNGDSSIS